MTIVGKINQTLIGTIVALISLRNVTLADRAHVENASKMYSQIPVTQQGRETLDISQVEIFDRQHFNENK